MAQHFIHCPYHPTAILVEDYRAGDQICSKCGLVIGDRVIDVSTEWRCFENGKILKNKINYDHVEVAKNPILENSDPSSSVDSSWGLKPHDESNTKN